MLTIALSESAPTTRVCKCTFVLLKWRRWDLEQTKKCYCYEKRIVFDFNSFVGKPSHGLRTNQHRHAKFEFRRWVVQWLETIYR